MEKPSYSGLVPPNNMKPLQDTFMRLQHQFGIDKAIQHKNWQRWWQGLISLRSCNIPPPPPLQSHELMFSQLHKTDPRGLITGLLIDTCMHPQGNGAPCAWHAHESPDGAIWVVERYGEVIAASWVWRHQSSVVIDLLEVERTPKGKYIVSRSGRIRPLYLQAAQSIIGKKGITHVYAGVKGGGFSWLTGRDIKRHFPSPAPYTQTGYSTEPIDDSEWVELIAGK